MEMNMLPSVQGDFKSIRNMWNTKVQEEQQLLKTKPIVCRTQSQLLQQPSIKVTIQSSISVNETISPKQSIITTDESEALDFKPIEKSPSIDDSELFLPLPPPPPTIILKGHIQSIVIMKQSVAKMFDFNTKKNLCSHIKNNGIRHWHLARHVFRSGLIFAPSRRASDSILPILMKTHFAQRRPRSESLDSIFMPTPLESLVDYLASDDDEKEQRTISKEKTPIKRTISDLTTCIERNTLNDTIAQYETLMRHLKNYDKFMSTYPASPPVPHKHSSIHKEEIMNKVEEDLQEHSTKKFSMQNRQTQSLARNAGRTFTDFFMNDLLLGPTSKNPAAEPKRSSIVHAASQTDLTEMNERMDPIIVVKENDKETKEVLEQFDTVLTNIQPKVNVPITANDEINVIVVNSPVVEEPKPVKKEKTLMQRLFEGKKTAYTSNDLEMETSRLTDELNITFELAKKKCFFPSENITYVTKMTKIDRRGYKQHIRILCITTERIYIITKKDPYPKEAVLFKDVLGISMTPRKDGFICIHTKETREDRGDWLFLLDHPCEFIVQLFMTMKRNNNDDSFLKIRTKFEHTRRSLATISDDCIIESRPSDTFRIAFENYEVLAIYSP
ncbi:hypothetical protein I4U23_012918 [Adineta vaga]|nr:hypothetical protein I4U23_012918 [Adineta vaga]